MRPEVIAFAELSPLPSYGADTSGENFARIESALFAISAPVSDEEARILVECFGHDDCFGLAWTLVDLIETSPSRTYVVGSGPLENCWKEVLQRRLKTRDVGFHP